MVVLALCALLLVPACSSSGRTAPAPPPPTSTSVTSTSAASTSTTVQTSGVRTVLSPLGLNIRGGPSLTAPVLGTAAQGAVLTVLGHTGQGGGWFSVKGATVTGWVTDNPRLTAEGTFKSYNSSQHQFSVLYPGTWTETEAPPASVVFHLPAGAGTVVVTTAATVAQLGRGRAGYQQALSNEVVVCGVTGDLVTYTQVSPPSSAASGPAGVVAQRYLAQARLALDAQHALGTDANLADTSALGAFRDFLNSLSFPFPQCEK
jgi:Bacterial SH3 domain